MGRDCTENRANRPDNTGPETAHVFAYGTLLFPDVWHRVVRGAYDRVPARIHGFSRRRLRDALFPAVVSACLTESVRGVLYLEVSADDLERIDRFEGPWYEKKTVACTREDGRIVPARVYVIDPKHRYRIEARTWDPEWFSRHGLPDFLAGENFT